MAPGVGLLDGIESFLDLLQLIIIIIMAVDSSNFILFRFDKSSGKGVVNWGKRDRMEFAGNELRDLEVGLEWHLSGVDTNAP